MPCFLCLHINSHHAPLLWRHNECDGVSNNRRHDSLHNHLFRHRSNKISKFRVTGFCAANSPVTGEFPAQRASNAENVSILMKSSCQTINWPLKLEALSYICHKSRNALDKYPTRHHCNKKVHTCAHFCYKMVHCVIWDWCIVGLCNRYIGLTWRGKRPKIPLSQIQLIVSWRSFTIGSPKSKSQSISKICCKGLQQAFFYPK